MTQSISLRPSVGPSYQASQWQLCHVLIDENEMSLLFDHLGDFEIVSISGLMELDQARIKKNEFLSVYGSYISALKRGGPLRSSSPFLFFIGIDRRFGGTLCSLRECQAMSCQNLPSCDSIASTSL